MRLFILVLIVLQFGYSNAQSTNGLIGHYEFEGSVIDSSSYKNHGRKRGTAFSDHSCNKLGKFISFNGTSDFVDIGYFDSLSYNLKSFSLCFWIKTKYDPNLKRWSTLLSSINNSSNGMVFSVDLFRGLQNVIESDALVLGLRDQSGKTLSILIHNKELYNNKWNHVSIVVKNSAQNAAEIYVNGDRQKKDSNAPRNSPNDYGKLDNPITIGCGNNRGNKSHYFKGSIDQLLIYNRALDTNEIETIISESKCLLGNENSFSKNTKLLVYPTIFDNRNGLISIDSRIASEQILRIEVINSSGELVRVIDAFDHQTNLRTIPTNIFEASGVYHIRIFTDKDLYIQRVIGL